MGYGKQLAAIVAALSTLAWTPAMAGDVASAEKLRRLDIMLMVTSLRCRTGPDDFQADYGRFATRHLATMNAAAAQLKANFARRMGAKGASRALDRMSVQMANQYGQGHPWLNCPDLKSVTRDLAKEKDDKVLLAAADELLSSEPRAGYALAKR